MVDTLHLETQDFTIVNIARFRVMTRANSIAGNLIIGYTTPEKEQPVKGVSAFSTVEFPNQDLRGKSTVYNHRLDIRFEVYTKPLENQKFLRIKISSLPKLLYWNNLFPFDRKEEYEEAMLILQGYARDYGVIVGNWNALKIIRMDLAFTMHTTKRAIDYVNVLKLASLKSYEKVIYSHGITFRGRKQNCSFYDKRYQMKEIRETLAGAYVPLKYDPSDSTVSKEQAEISPEELPYHCLRIEYKFSDYKTIAKVFEKISTWGDLVNPKNGMAKIFHDKVRKFIDSVPGAHAQTQSAGEALAPKRQLGSNIPESLMEKFIREFMKEHGKNWYAKFVKALGEQFIHTHLSKSFFSALDSIWEIKSTTGKADMKTKYQQRFRIKTSIEKSAKHLATLPENYAPYKSTDLLEELKEQLRGYMWSEFIFGAPMPDEHEERFSSLLSDSHADQAGQAAPLTDEEERNFTEAGHRLRKRMESYSHVIRQKIRYDRVAKHSNV